MMDRANENTFRFDFIYSFFTLKDKTRNITNLVCSENYITFTWFRDKSGVISFNTTLYFVLGHLFCPVNRVFLFIVNFILIYFPLLVTFGKVCGFPFFCHHAIFQKILF